MAIRRRKRVVRRHRRRGRRLYGGLMTEGQPAQPLDHSEVIAQAENLKATGQRQYEPSNWEYLDWGRWLDRSWNQDRMTKSEMDPIMAKYRSGDATQKQQAIEDMRTKLILRDIQKSPEEYIEEWQRGKHKKINHLKALGRVGEAGAFLGLAFLLGKTGAVPGLYHGVKRLFGSNVMREGTEKVGSTAANWLTADQPLAANTASLINGAKTVDKLGIGNIFNLDEGMLKAGTESAAKNLLKNFDLSTITKEGNDAIMELYDTGMKVRSKFGEAIFVPKEDAVTYMLNNPEGFDKALSIKGQLYKVLGPFLSPWYMRIFGAKGSGYRISRKGHRLLRRYRRHLRHRRRY